MSQDGNAQRKNGKNNKDALHQSLMDALSKKSGVPLTNPSPVQQERSTAPQGTPDRLEAVQKAETIYQQFEKAIGDAEHTYRDIKEAFTRDELHYRAAQDRYETAQRAYQEQEAAYLQGSQHYIASLTTRIKEAPDATTPIQGDPTEAESYQQLEQAYQASWQDYQQAATAYHNARCIYQASLDTYQQVESSYLDLLRACQQARVLYVHALESHVTTGSV